MGCDCIYSRLAADQRAGWGHKRELPMLGFCREAELKVIGSSE